jgi:hypothetical protein
MKTLKLQLATLTAIFALFTISLTANTNYPSLLEETYINDIPFDTEIVAESYSMNEMEKDFDFSEEYEISDIPFNTACITADCRYETAISETFIMEEEMYINDIPFNTEKISSVVSQIDFKDEAYINDIPFDTFSVVNNLDCPEYAMN